MGNQYLDSNMKFTQTLPIFALAVNAAPTSNQQAVENVASDLSAKGVDWFQSLADQYGIGVDVQAKVDQIEKAAQQYYDAKKIRNRNKNKTPSQILDSLTQKINGLTRRNVENKELKKNLVAMTKQLKNMTQSAVQDTEGGDKKAKDLWKDAASMMEAEADKALAEAQSQVRNL